MTKDAETRLVDQAKSGSEEAFAELLRMHQAYVRAYLTGLVRDWASAEDLAQDAFIAAYRNLETYRGSAPFRQWLLGIARNLGLMHLRREEQRRSHQSHTPGSTLNEWLIRQLESDASAVARQERSISALDACLKRLPPESAALVNDYYLSRRNTSQMAHDRGKKEARS